MMRHESVPGSLMRRAFAEARAAAERGEVPVGAVVSDSEGLVLAAAGNRVIELADPTAHAEILAIRTAAARLGRPRLEGCDLTVTLEPCPMCAHAIALARIRRLIFAAYAPGGGGVEHGARIFARPGCNHRPMVIGGVDEVAAAGLLRQFFREQR